MTIRYFMARLIEFFEVSFLQRNTEFLTTTLQKYNYSRCGVNDQLQQLLDVATGATNLSFGGVSENGI
jgi:hypothetical protein